MSGTPEEIRVDLSLATRDELRDELEKRFPDGIVIIGGIRTKKDMPLIQTFKSKSMLNSTAIGLLEMYKVELVASYVNAPQVDMDGKSTEEDEDE